MGCDCDGRTNYSVNNITDPGAQLRIDSNNKYQHTTGTPVQFWRMITTTKNPDGDGSTEDLKVESTVRYLTSAGSYRTITLTEILYDWKP